MVVPEGENSQIQKTKPEILEQEVKPKEHKKVVSISKKELMSKNKEVKNDEQ